MANSIADICDVLIIYIYSLSVAWVWLAVVASDRTVSLLELVASSSSLQDNNVTWPSSLERRLALLSQRDPISFSFLFLRANRACIVKLVH